MLNRWLRSLTLVFTCLLSLAAMAAEKHYRVFVGTYTEKQSKGIYSFQFDPATGKSSAPQLAGETVNPSWLAVDRAGKFLYAVNEIDNYQGTKSGAVSVFAIERPSAKLTFLQQVASLGTDPAYLTLDHTGRDLLVANYSGGNVAVFPIGKDGKLGEHTALDQHQGSSVDKERQEAPHAHSIQMTADNRFALSADLGTDEIRIDRFDAPRGTLTPNQPASAKVSPGAGPRHVAIAPSGKFIYVLNEMGTNVTLLSFDPKTAATHELQTIDTVEKHNPANTAAEITFSPSGEFLYTSTRGEDTITVFAVEQATGKLKLAGRTAAGGKTPRFFTLDPTGQWMLVANQDSNNIVVFQVDPKTGIPSPAGEQLEVGSPVCLVFVAWE